MNTNSKKLNNACGYTGVEGCFKTMKINTTLMNEIKQLGLCENQERFVHEMVNRIIDYSKKGFVYGTNKIDALIVSWLDTWCNCPESELIRHIGKYKGITYTELLKDYEDMFSKGTIIGTLNENPFPAVEEPYIYRELLDPDNYNAPHYVLDFVNKKLNEALPGYNLWAKADDLDLLSIYDLNVLPHMKTY